MGANLHFEAPVMSETIVHFIEGSQVQRSYKIVVFKCKRKNARYWDILKIFYDDQSGEIVDSIFFKASDPVSPLCKVRAF